MADPKIGDTFIDEAGKWVITNVDVDVFTGIVRRYRSAPVMVAAVRDREGAPLQVLEIDRKESTLRDRIRQHGIPDDSYRVIDVPVQTSISELAAFILEPTINQLTLPKGPL